MATEMKKYLDLAGLQRFYELLQTKFALKGEGGSGDVNLINAIKVNGTLVPIDSTKTANITIDLSSYAKTADISADLAKAHEHSNKTVLDGITDAKVNAWDAAEQNAKDYVDEKIGDVDFSNDFAAKAYEARVETLIGSDLNMSVRDIAAAEVAKVVADADESFDTLKEIADWITNDTTGAAKMASDIADLQAAGAEANVIEGIQLNGEDLAVTDKKVNIVISLDDYAKTSDVNDAIDTAIAAAKLALLGEEGYGQTIKSAYELAEAAKGIADDAAAFKSRIAALEAIEHFDPSNKDVLSAITADDVNAWGSALADAKSYADGIVATEKSDRETADADLDGKITAEATLRAEAITAEATAREAADAEEASIRAAADSAEVTNRNTAIDNALNYELHVIAEHEINKMFGSTETYEGTTAAELSTSIQSLSVGDTLKIQSDVTADATNPKRGIELTDGFDGTIDLSDGGTITAGDGGAARVIHVSEGASLEVVGGTISNVSAGNPTLTVWNDASMILNGTEVKQEGTQTVISTNGNNENSNITIKNAALVGSCYFPACGTLVIENSVIEPNENDEADACGVYVKSGTVVIRNSVIKGAQNLKSTSGNWKHSNNGFYGIGCALIIENCNYGNHGNVDVTIDSDSQFVAGASGEDFNNVGILVINYNGNKGNLNIGQEYYTVDITEVTPETHKFTLEDLTKVNG